MADINLNEPLDAARAQRTATTGFLAGQEAKTGDFLSRYKGAIGGQESTSAIASRIGAELGLPTLQANANSLQQTLFNLPSTYSKATTGYDVNANQLSRIIGTKQAELAPAAALASENVQNAQTSLDRRLGYEQTDQAKALLPYQTEQSLLTDRLARETTLFSKDNEAELDAIVAKLNAGVQISEGEKTRAHQLAVAEKEYQNTLALNKQSQGFQADEAKKNRLLQLAGNF